MGGLSAHDTGILYGDLGRCHLAEWEGSLQGLPDVCVSGVGGVVGAPSRTQKVQ